jgi:anti-sigma regulatory factor (Ser/Thr protein kinase)
METKTRAADANEFCLVLTATLDAGVRAGEAVRERFTSLPQEARRDLAAVVAELVQSSVERRPGGPITVTVVVGSDEIHGEVSDHGNTAITPRVANRGDQNGNGFALVDRLTSEWAFYEGSTDVWFEIPLGVGRQRRG